MLKGGCLCGAVRYEVDAAPMFTFICTCRDCVRISAGARFAGFTVRADQARVSGATKSFVSTGGSGQPVQRRFCPECGAYVNSTPDVMPDTLNFSIGSLDDPSAVSPAMQLYARSQPGWDARPEGMAVFETLPPGAPGT